MDVVMVAGGVMFFVLFVFLMFVFVVYAVSLFVRRSFPDFEPGISVVIPAFNEEKNIAACLDSVFASDYAPDKIEVIVVDDGSTDSTVKIAKSYKSVKCVSAPHSGKAVALTVGAKAARHGFVLTIDADTFLEKECIRHLIKPLTDQYIGAVTGMCKVKNRSSLLGMFQNIEYHYNNLIKNSFSVVFNNGIWFFGALACYRKAALAKVGYFKPHTLAEDMDIVLELRKEGYRTYSVKDAVSFTIVPDTILGFYSQRSRWWLGTLQALVRNRQLFSLKSSPSVLFLYINQFWWSFYSFVSLPLIIYQVFYWLPYNSQSIASVFGYLFRWFSLAGPTYVVYKVPQWGLSYYSFFGVLGGLISAFMILSSIRLFKDKLHIRNLFALFFYFPYTIVINLVTFISLLRFRSLRTRFFIK
ncbi:glycosyltransferase [Candidatus Woesearchaeota archaeon]|nr:glycosyltransferase [Candidatus Woesearchaeota archaeon]